MLRAQRFQLRLKPAQEAQLRRFAGMARWVWSRALAEQRARHERGEPCAGPAGMCRWLTAWRHDPETAWLAEGPVHPQQQVLRRLDAAFRRFLANVKAGKAPGLPRFKRRGEEPGLRFPDPKQFAPDKPNSRVRLPKLGWARLRLSRAVEGELRNACLTREGSRCFCALQVELPDVMPSGDLARTERHPVIAIEDLKVAAMTASARGTAGQPGRRVRQKAGLNRGILDAARGEFRRQLAYKCAARRGAVATVNPAYTSQACRLCGRTSVHNRKTQARFACGACGHAEHADAHAAKNILAAGHAAWTAQRRSAAPSAACGGTVRRCTARERRAGAAPSKQEPAQGVVHA